jgi:hypothetical protein
MYFYVLIFMLKILGKQPYENWTPRRPDAHDFYTPDFCVFSKALKLLQLLMRDADIESFFKGGP